MDEEGMPCVVSTQNEPCTAQADAAMEVDCCAPPDECQPCQVLLNSSEVAQYYSHSTGNYLFFPHHPTPAGLDPVSPSACQLCPGVFSSPRRLQRHHSDCHASPSDSHSSVADIDLSPIRDFLRNSTKTIFVHCVQCDEDINCEFYFKEHFSVCAKAKTCPLCNVKELGDIVPHLEQHVKRRDGFVDCRTCGSYFITDENAKSHRRSQHSHVNGGRYSGEPVSTVSTRRKTLGLRGGARYRALRTSPDLNGSGTSRVSPKAPGSSPVAVLPAKRSSRSQDKGSSRSQDKGSGVTAPDCELPEALLENGPPTTNPVQLKEDIRKVLLGVEERCALPDDCPPPSILCGSCHTLCGLHNYALHLPDCLQDANFACPLCEERRGPETSGPDRWTHVRRHLLDLTAGGHSECYMCSETFVTEFNMLLHAQFMHFL